MAGRDVGSMGQSEFERLCSSVGLTRNVVREDKTGWDYFVEFPLPRAPGQPADMAPPARQCLVQVKATDSHRRKWDIALRNLERLAKSPMPAFVCLLEFNGGEHAQHVYLVHIGEVIIGRILKRLRQLEKTSRSVKKKPILSITFDNAHRLPQPTGACMKSAIESHVPQGFGEYSRCKKGLLDTLGYEHGHGYVNMCVSGRDPIKDLTDLFLGLRKSLEVDKVAMYDTRFNVDCLLPLPSGRAQLSISSSVLPAVVVFRERKSSPGVEFLASVHLPSMNRVLPRERFILRVETRLFDIILEPFRGSARFTLSPGVWESPLELGKLTSFLNLLQMFRTQTSQGIWMSISLSGKVFDGRMKGPVDQDIPHSVEGLRAVERALVIAQRAGVADNMLVSLDYLTKRRAQIEAFYEAITPGASPVTLRFSVAESPEGVQERIAVVLQTRLDLGEYLIYCFFGLVGKVEQIEDRRYKFTSQEKSFHKYAWTSKDSIMEDAEQTQYNDSVVHEMEAMNVAPTIVGPTLIFVAEK
jgi:hypothetical protein